MRATLSMKPALNAMPTSMARRLRSSRRITASAPARLPAAATIAMPIVVTGATVRSR